MYGSDPAPRRDPSTTAQWWFTGIFLVGIIGLFAADIIHHYSPIKLSAFLVLLFWIPLLALHEAGHAIVAWLLGWHVTHIVIGMGKSIGAFRIGSAGVDIRMFPIEGFVRCTPTNLNLPGFKHALIYFAGPGADLLVALLTLALLGPDRLFIPSDQYIDILWQSLALAAASQGIMNLIPMSTSTPDGFIANDGLGILLSLARPSSVYAEMIEQAKEMHPDEPDGR